MSTTTADTAIAVLHPNERTQIMQVISSVNDEGTHIVNVRKPVLRRAIHGAMAAGLIAVAAASVPRAVTAQDSRACSNATLRGEYGFMVSGIRAVGPGVTEMFVGTGLQTYDGNGSLTQVDSANGQLTGVVRDRQASGTYEVNADCTGTASLIFPGVPFPIQSSFVLVDRGAEVKSAVMSPQSNLVTAIARRK
jgi:hypothetical protein